MMSCAPAAQRQREDEAGGSALPPHWRTAASVPWRSRGAKHGIGAGGGKGRLRRKEGGGERGGRGRKAAQL